MHNDNILANICVKNKTIQDSVKQSDTENISQNKPQSGKYSLRLLAVKYAKIFSITSAIKLIYFTVLNAIKNTKSNVNKAKIQPNQPNL